MNLTTTSGLVIPTVVISALDCQPESALSFHCKSTCPSSKTNELPTTPLYAPSPLAAPLTTTRWLKPALRPVTTPRHLPANGMLIVLSLFAYGDPSQVSLLLGYHTGVRDFCSFLTPRRRSRPRRGRGRTDPSRRTPAGRCSRGRRRCRLRRRSRTRRGSGRRPRSSGRSS